MFSVAAASAAGIGPETGSGDGWGLQLDASAFAAAVESKGISADKPVVVSVITCHGICDILICERLVAGRETCSGEQGHQCGHVGGDENVHVHTAMSGNGRECQLGQPNACGVAGA